MADETKRPDIKAAKLLVSRQLIHDALLLPDDCNVLGDRNGAVEIWVQHADLPDGAVCVVAHFTREAAGNAEFARWERVE